MLRNRGIAQKGENTMSEIEKDIIGFNGDEDDDIAQEKNRFRNVDPQAIEPLDITPGRRNMYDVLRKITLEELNSDNVEVGRSVLTLQLVGIKAAADHSSAKGTQGQFNYKLKSQNQQVGGQYQRMFLFCDVNSPNDLCCYVIESGGKNKNLWNKILFIMTME